MELPLETVALYALKLAYEREGSSPILRDDPAMSDYQRDVFAFDVRKGDIAAIQGKIERCLALAQCIQDRTNGLDKALPALTLEHLEEALKDIVSVLVLHHYCRHTQRHRPVNKQRQAFDVGG